MCGTYFLPTVLPLIMCALSGHSEATGVWLSPTRNIVKQLMVLLGGSRRQFKEQLKQVREEIRQSQEKAANKIARKERRGRSGAYTFKKNGNERQDGFNAKVGDKIGDALAKLDTVSPTASVTYM